MITDLKCGRIKTKLTSFSLMWGCLDYIEHAQRKLITQQEPLTQQTSHLFEQEAPLISIILKSV